MPVVPLLSNEILQADAPPPIDSSLERSSWFLPASLTAVAPLPLMMMPAMILMAGSGREFWNRFRTSRGLAERVLAKADLDALDVLFGRYAERPDKLDPLLMELAVQRPNLFASSLPGIRFIAGCRHPEKGRLLKSVWEVLIALPEDALQRQQRLTEANEALRRWVSATDLAEGDRNVLLTYGDLSPDVLASAPVELVAKILQNLPDLSDPRALPVSELLAGHQGARFEHFPTSLWQYRGPTPLREAALRRLARESYPSGPGFKEALPGWDDEAVYALNRGALAAVLGEDRYRNNDTLCFLAHVRLHQAVQGGGVETLPTPILVEEIGLAPEAIDWAVLAQVEKLLLRRADASLPDLCRAGRTDLALRIFAKRVKKVERRDFEESFPGWFDPAKLSNNLNLLSGLLNKSELSEAEFRVLEAVAELQPGLDLFPWLLPYEGPQHLPETGAFILKTVQKLMDLHDVLVGNMKGAPSDPLLTSAHALRLDGEENRLVAAHIGSLLREGEYAHFKWIASYSQPPGGRMGRMQALYLVPIRENHRDYARRVTAIEGRRDNWALFEGGRITVNSEAKIRIKIEADSRTLGTISRGEDLQSRMVADVRRVLQLETEPFGSGRT